MKSTTSRAILHRQKPKDIFLTPDAVAKKLISMIHPMEDEVWLDPFKGAGAFYNNFPAGVTKDYDEILEGRDFLKRDSKVDVICSNPPFSIIDEILLKIGELKPRLFAFVVLHGAMTPKRLELLQKIGYGYSKIHICKVYQWYGMVELCVFERGVKNVAEISWDRVVYRLSDAETKSQEELRSKI